MSDDPMRLEFDGDGVLHLAGRDGWREPICPKCHEPIRWVLDMASFTSGPDHRLAHARCVWLKDAFRKQERQVVDGHDDSAPR